MSPRFLLMPLACAAMAALVAGCAHQSPSAQAAASAPTVTAHTQPQEPATMRQEIAPNLYEIAFSPKQNAVYVASAGGREGKPPAPRVFKLDPQTLAVQAEIVLPRPGLGLAMDDAHNRLYVGNAFDASITVINTETNAIERTIQLSDKVTMKDFDGKETTRYPHNLRELVLDAKNNRLFAPGLWINDSVLYVVNTETQAVEKVIPGFGFGAAGITLNPATDTVYVGNMQGQLFTINAQTLALEKVQEVAADQLLNLVIDGPSQRILATDHGSDQPNTVREQFAKIPYTVRHPGNRVAVIDPATGAITESIATGERPVALLLDAGRQRLFVTNRESGTVTVHDSRTHRLLHTFETPVHPNSLALDPATGVVYATVKNPADAPSPLESVVRLAF